MIEVLFVVGGEFIVAAFASVTGEGDIAILDVDIAAFVGCVRASFLIWLVDAALPTNMANTGP